MVKNKKGARDAQMVMVAEIDENCLEERKEKQRRYSRNSSND